MAWIWSNVLRGMLMGGTDHALAVGQFSRPCGERAAAPEPLMALPHHPGTRVIPYCGLVYAGLCETVLANPRRRRFAQASVEPTGFVNQFNMRSAKATPITASQAQDRRRNVAPQVRVDHRHGCE
jgi:hypothetical protein